VPLPAQPRADDLVDAVGREGGDQPVDVAAVLGDGWGEPEPLDPRALGWGGGTQSFLSGRGGAGWRGSGSRCLTEATGQSAEGASGITSPVRTTKVRAVGSAAAVTGAGCSSRHAR